MCSPQGPTARLDPTHLLCYRSTSYAHSARSPGAPVLDVRLATAPGEATRPIVAVQSVQRWLPQTETWLYTQLSSCARTARATW
jgi:hypothetical protein